MKARVGIDRGGSGTVLYVDLEHLDIGWVRHWTWAMAFDPTPGDIRDDNVAAALATAFVQLMLEDWERNNWEPRDLTYRQTEVEIYEMPRRDI